MCPGRSKGNKHRSHDIVKETVTGNTGPLLGAARLSSVSAIGLSDCQLSKPQDTPAPMPEQNRLPLLLTQPLGTGRTAALSGAGMVTLEPGFTDQS